MKNEILNRGGTQTSDLELYRIIVMFQIAVHHYVVNLDKVDRGVQSLLQKLEEKT